jgi:hypothetical protein
MPEEKRWVITTEGSRSLSEIQKDLVSKGFTIENVLSEIGCITGAANDESIEKLRKIPGVADISPEPPPIDIGPPNSSFTW